MKNELMNEIRRAYSVLGVQAEFQNAVDIAEWEKQHIVDSESIKELRNYNRMLSKRF